jgi:hypothetical protein
MAVDELVTQLDEQHAPITRKKALKRIGAGALAVWAVPLFATTGGAGARTLGCANAKCPANSCGTACYKFRSFDFCSSGLYVCANDMYCSWAYKHTCTKHSDCGAGWHCGLTCCSNDSGMPNHGNPPHPHCLPPCGIGKGQTYPLSGAGAGVQGDPTGAH